jgi:outer membrane protein assembly factor BamB
MDNPQVQAGGGVVILQSGAPVFSGRFTVFDGKTGRLLWRASAKAARGVPSVGVGSI